MAAVLKLRFQVAPLRSDLLNYPAPVMQQVGERLVRSINQRLTLNMNSFGAQMEPLTPSYKKRKIKRGKSGFRDMKLTGRMRKTIQVLEVSENHVTVGLSDGSQAIKAVVNQQRSHWFGMAQRDAFAVDDELQAVQQQRFGGLLNVAA